MVCVSALISLQCCWSAAPTVGALTDCYNNSVCCIQWYILRITRHIHHCYC